MAAVAVKNGSIVATGVSRPPRGRKCHGYEKIFGTNKKEPHSCIHAEINMILKATTSLRGSDIYTTLSCCPACLSILTDLEVHSIFYLEEYARVYPRKLFQEMIPMIKVYM